MTLQSAVHGLRKGSHDVRRVMSFQDLFKKLHIVLVYAAARTENKQTSNLVNVSPRRALLLPNRDIWKDPEVTKSLKLEII